VAESKNVTFPEFLRITERMETNSSPVHARIAPSSDRRYAFAGGTPRATSRACFVSLILIFSFINVDTSAWGANSQMSKQPSCNDYQEQKTKLTPEQYRVTQEGATERPFQNAYWNNHEAGIYVDVVSGKPLFSSLDKFDSGTGWPSFTRPLRDDAIVKKTDHSFGMDRTEIRSKDGDSHLGHLFDDGPSPTGQRYCTNSASLRFVPVDHLAQEGFGEYLPLFGRPAPVKANSQKTPGAAE